MARGRIISPEFWTDSAIVRLTPFARLLYIGMWNHAFCDRGHLNDDAWDLKLKILPADDIDPDALLAELTSAGRVVREARDGGRTFLSIPTFRIHQKADDPRYTRKCPFCLESTTEHGSARPSATEHDNSHTRGEGNGGGLEGEGITRGARPPRYCPQHPKGTDGGCFKCRDARIAQQEWDEARKGPSRLQPPPKRGDGHACADVGSGYCVACGEKVA